MYMVSSFLNEHRQHSGRCKQIKKGRVHPLSFMLSTYWRSSTTFLNFNLTWGPLSLSSLALFPSIDCLFIPSSFSNQMQTADIQHHSKSWFTYTFLTTITHIRIGHKAFSLPHRNNIFEHTKANKRLSFTFKYTHILTLTRPNLCVLFALSEMYCLGKWACAPSGGISMNKNLNALPHYFSPSLTFSISHALSLSVWPLPLSAPTVLESSNWHWRPGY